jgi:PAS domain S-box-containing protein
MEKTLSARNRSLLRELISRSFDSGAEAAGEICRLVRTAFDADIVYVSRLDGTEVEILAVEDALDSGLTVGARVPLDETFCQRALGGTGPQASADLSSGPYADLVWPRRIGVASYAMSPLWSNGGQATGTLSVLDRRPREFGDEELALLELLGGLLSREQRLDRVRLREAARSAELEVSDGRYRSVVDDLGDVIVELDSAGRLVYVNRACSELVGIPVEDMVGKDMMEHVHPEDRMAAAAHMAEVISGADTVRTDAAREVRFIAGDGSLRWMSVRGRAVFDDEGQLAGFLGILHDVTVRVESENRVRAALAEAEAARDEAQRASVAKSEFLSRMSHELRTPLNAILGFGQLLELGELDGEDAENVDQILRAGRHLLDLINEVLDVVRIESGSLSLSLEPVDLGDVVAESLDLVRPAAATHGISLRTPNRFHGGAVVADRQRLKQILVNLLSNAVKYNRDGGEVVVDWAAEPAAATEPGADHGWLRLSVKDTGHGIPGDRLDDVFTPFDRLGAEGTGIEGTGVGLSLTKTLVQALGGRIGLTSELGTGSTFWVDLPAAALPEARPVEAEAAPELSRTVLYIEDNPSNITLVRRVLARRPHVRLVVVQDGAEAVEAAHDLLPDMVLLDLHLPGMHGGGILTALRGSDDARMRKVPIVVVTADLTVGNERRMIEAGATMFLPKPIDVHRLLAVVDDHLPQT